MKIEFFRHNVTEEDIVLANQTLQSIFLTTGPMVERFEKRFAQYLGIQEAVGLTSCTGAIHLALLRHGIAAGDEVITTPMTFVATATAILQTGAIPVFIDVCPKTGMILPQAVKIAITEKTKAILPVHLYGRMADVRGFSRIAKGLCYDGNMKVVCTLHDPESRFLPMAERFRDDLGRFLDGAIVSHTKETSKDLISLLEGLGTEPILGGKWGEARKIGIAEALKSGEKRFFYVDFDKILHWLDFARDEFISLLNYQLDKDFLILGRGKKVFETYPCSWQKTESIINNLVSQKFGFQVDVMASACILNRKVGEMIARESKEKEWGSCAEWPLLAYNAGLKIGYLEVAGLTWEDPDRFSEEIQKVGNLELWKEENYDSINEWEKRVTILGQHLAVMRRLG